MICSTAARGSGVSLLSSSSSGQKASATQLAPGMALAAEQISSRVMDGAEAWVDGVKPVGIWVPKQAAQWETVEGERQVRHCGERGGRAVGLRGKIAWDCQIFVFFFVRKRVGDDDLCRNGAYTLCTVPRHI